MMHGLDLQHGRWRKIVQKNASFNLRLDDAPVHFVREVRMRVKHTIGWASGYRVSWLPSSVLSLSGPSRRARPLDGRTYPQVAANVDVTRSDPRHLETDRLIRPAKRSAENEVPK